MSGTIKSAYLHQTGSRAILPFAGCPLCTLASASGSAKPRGFSLHWSWNIVSRFIGISKNKGGEVSTSKGRQSYGVSPVERSSPM